jgi:hypothetical protein
VFPPEPSAWEKQYLGWVTPVVVTSPAGINSVAASIDNGNSSVFKFLIDAKEYFLAENRNRDANNNGSTVYYINNGLLDSLKFQKDETGFQNGEIWKLKGSIIDIDEPDWSLPGLKNDTANFQGGILVWHIDENVIDEKIASNTINNDIKHRGVDLEEAKGAQDIGVKINTPFGQFIGDGTPFDYWYSGEHYVPVSVYKNEFTQTSIPNSKTYTNLNSRVCLRNFSVIGGVMTFNYDQCGSITNINSFPRFVGLDTTGFAQPIGIDYNVNGLDEIFINVKDSLYGFRENGSPIRVDMPNGFLEDSITNKISAYTTVSGNGYIVGTYDNDIVLVSFSIDSSTGAPVVERYNSGVRLTSPSLIKTDMTNMSNTVFTGTENGKIAKFNLSNNTFTFDSVSNTLIKELASSFSGGLPGYYSYIDAGNKFIAEGIFPSGQFNELQSVSVIVNNSENIVIGNNTITQNAPYSSINSSPVIADLNNDRNQEIIFTAGNKVWAVNRNGVVIDNFPFSVTGIDKITSGVSVADLNGDGVFEVIFGTGDGRVYAYSTNGKILEGFPLLAGKEVKSTPAIINNNGNFGILAYSQDGYLYGWKTSWAYDSSKVLWSNYLKDENHSNVNNKVSGTVVSGPCLPKEKFYNWPNPVYGKTTNIRYYLNGDASSIKVKIMDLSGELVTTLTGTAFSGFDNEVVWDVSNVQSGIYIGVIEMEGGCGETASIKIAVVK